MSNRPVPMFRPLLRLFDLRRDQESAENIDLQIREGVDAVGTNLWVLVMAIFIASIGLNVNSTAVIIGAMLISPLMGPIVGIGYAAGVHDFPLMRRASRSLGVMTLFSLITATLYFSVTPLNEAQSELLARTSPTLWDVLIAFFGGSAGIVAITRKEISNVVPGVAIATALMPPLCTTGYGIANGNWAFAAGAFYLFMINSVFIALSALLFAKVARLPEKEWLDPSLATRNRWMLAGFITLLIVPSGILALRLVRAEQFEASARDVLRNYADDPRFYLLGADIDGKARSLRLAVTGEMAPDDIEAELANRFRVAGVEKATVLVRRAGNNATDLRPIEEFLAQRERSSAQRELDESRSRALALEAENAALRTRESVKEALLVEVAAQFPEAERITVSSGRGFARLAVPGAPVPDADRSGQQGDGAASLPAGDDGEIGAPPAPDPLAPVEETLLIVEIVLPAPIDQAQADRLLRGWQARYPAYRVRFDVRAPDGAVPGGEGGELDPSPGAA